MSWGLQNRLSRIMQPKDGRTVMLAVDHGYFLGPTSGLESIKKSIVPLAPYADTLMLTRGILRSDIPRDIDTPIALRVSGANSVLDDDLSNETIITDIEDVIRLNAAAMALSIFVGSAYQHQTIANLAKLIDQGERYGIPVIAVTAVGKEMVRDARYLSLATRIAAEMGAHIVKTYYVEDDFERITSTCSVPVVMAGGKKLPERDALQMTFNAMARGASGVDMGRNIFQSDSPLGMIQAVNAVVHEDASVDDAFTIYMDEKAKSGTSATGVSADDSRKI